MALDLDFLTQVVNVSWGGGTVFVYGEWLGNLLHFVNIAGPDATPEQRTISLPEPPGRDLDTRGISLFGVTGSSYAKVGDDKTSTFLICGNRSVPHDIDDGIGNLTGVIDRHALIYISNDGLSWRVARLQSEIISDFDFQPSVIDVALVWDSTKHSFYYDQNYSEFHPHTGAGQSLDQIFSSANGTTWRMGSSTQITADYQSAFPVLCSSNDCLDQRGQHVPDGVMTKDEEESTDETKKTTMKPTKPPVVSYLGGGGVSYDDGKNTVEVTREVEDSDGGTKTERATVAIPGVGCVTCVAGHNGIYMAGGFVDANDIESKGAVAISIDDGKTWQLLAHTANGVTTMVAAADDAFKKT